MHHTTLHQRITLVLTHPAVNTQNPTSTKLHNFKVGSHNNQTNQYQHQSFKHQPKNLNYENELEKRQPRRGLPIWKSREIDCSISVHNGRLWCRSKALRPNCSKIESERWRRWRRGRDWGIRWKIVEVRWGFGEDRLAVAVCEQRRCSRTATL